jgi:hypothetical protein
VTAGSPDRAIVITGTGFLPTSAVKSNGVAVVTSYTSPTQLGATVPSAQLLYPGNVSITVTNPAPGGGTSAPSTISVGCDNSGVDVQLNAVGVTVTLDNNFAAAPKLSVFYDGDNPPWNGSCQSTELNAADQEPARYWVVQNTSGASITLSSWAVCTADGKSDDAFLTYYRRPTPPATDNERFDCENVVSEGNGMGAGWLSPEAGASQLCPGLTKANGGGMTLAACEKAVVHIQAFSLTDPTYTAPPQIRVKAE